MFFFLDESHKNWLHNSHHNDICYLWASTTKVLSRTWSSVANTTSAPTLHFLLTFQNILVSTSQAFHKLGAKWMPFYVDDREETLHPWLPARGAFLERRETWALLTHWTLCWQKLKKRARCILLTMTAAVLSSTIWDPQFSSINALNLKTSSTNYTLGTKKAKPFPWCQLLSGVLLA